MAGDAAESAESADPPERGPFGRLMERVSATPTFAKVAPPIVTNLDRFVHWLTRGRRIMSKGVLPVLMLTTTGAKTGEARNVPLACIPDGDVLYLVGSNFGREHHPAWTGNLIKTPQATVAYEEETFAVTATLLSADEKEQVWPKLLAMWPNYERYQLRSGRDIRVFRLERNEGGPDGE